MTAMNLNRAIRGPVTAVPVVAGKGVRIVPDVENNRFVVEADETVLWEGTPGSSSYQITLSENLSNFEYFAVEWKSYERRYRDNFNAATTAQSITLGACFVNNDGNYEKSLTTWGTTDGSAYIWKATIHGGFQSSQSSSWNSNVVPLRIIGINRISST